MVWEIISVNRGNWIYIFAVLATLLSWVEWGGICLCSVQGGYRVQKRALPCLSHCSASCLYSAGRPEQIGWSSDGVLASVPIWAVCLCAVQRGARGRRRGSTQGSIRATTKSRPLLEPLPSPLPLPRPHALDANYNLLRGSLPSQSYFTFAHPSLDIHLRKRGQY